MSYIKDKLEFIMLSGWDTTIECKGKGRDDQLSYEVVASKVVDDNMSFDDMFEILHKKITVLGDNLEDLIDDITTKITIMN